MVRNWACGVLAALLALPAAHAAAQAAGDKQEVLERVSALEEELSLLKRKLEVQDEAAASRAPQPVVGAGQDGFYLRSADAKYQIKLRGYTQFDGRFFNESASARTPE